MVFINLKIEALKQFSELLLSIFRISIYLFVNCLVQNSLSCCGSWSVSYSTVIILVKLVCCLSHRFQVAHNYIKYGSMVNKSDSSSLVKIIKLKISYNQLYLLLICSEYSNQKLFWIETQKSHVISKFIPWSKQFTMLYPVLQYLHDTGVLSVIAKIVL